MRPVMADQHPRVLSLHRAHEPLAFGRGGRDQLFHERGELHFDALQSLRHMQLVGRGEHDAVGGALRSSSSIDGNSGTSAAAAAFPAAGDGSTIAASEHVRLWRSASMWARPI